jgi:small-conductance mechanosensitive channel
MQPEAGRAGNRAGIGISLRTWLKLIALVGMVTGLPTFAAGPDTGTAPSTPAAAEGPGHSGVAPLSNASQGDADEADKLRVDQAAVQRIGAHLQPQQISDAALKELIQTISGYKSAAEQCISAQETRASRDRAQLKALGPAVKGEEWDVTATRLQLERQQTQSAQQLAACRVLEINSANLLRGLEHEQDERLAGTLIERGVPTGVAFAELLTQIGQSSSLFDVKVLLDHLRAYGGSVLPWLAGLALVGLAAGLVRRRRLADIAPVDPAQDLARAVFQAILLSLNRYRPGLLVTGLWSLYWLAVGAPPMGRPLLAGASFALFGYHLALVAIRASFNPPPPARSYLPFPQPLARPFSRSLRWLALNGLIGALLFATPLAKLGAEPLVLVAHSVWDTLLVFNLIWTVWLIRRLRGKQGVGVVRLIIVLALWTGLAAEWAGYRNLSAFIIGGVVLTVVALLLAWLAAELGGDLIDSLEEGRHAWERRLQVRLGISGDNFVPGLFWLRILLHVLIWAALVFALLRIWGLPSDMQLGLLRAVAQGFTIGNVTVEPLRVLLALLVLTVLLSFGSWARTRLDQRLSHARLERGAREASVAIAGYGVMIAAGIVSLTVAGVAFQNLAIIAGALSVGIGFGLQNIVNNFVSGLILLFERPVRTGDWIVVGSTEGYVRRISIRSTQIQTFDRADVIVPNSELISGAVTNWMLRDTHGRVRAPVGVAYGSDTQQVKDILLLLAREHPLVIHGSAVVPDPYVWFLSFGDSSLNFELCAFVRDVSRRMTVLSDLNFAIDAAFREAGIQIPFPQRDLHVITPPTPKEPPA